MEYTRSTPAYEYADPRPIYTSQTNGNARALFITLANLTLTGGMIWLNAGSLIAVIGLIVYFVISTSLFQIIDSGQFAVIVQVLTDAKTQRELNRLQYTVSRPTVDPLPELAEPKPAQIVASSFVAPVDDSVRREAAAWLVQLFDDRGQPDSRKVLLNTTKERPGRIRIKAPSDAATEYLVQRGVLRVRVKDGQRNGYALNMRYSLRDDALRVLQPNYGVTG